MTQHLLAAYDAVIRDLSNDIGYLPGVQEAALDVLNQRVHELSTVWSDDND
jgi:hypothetical protein